MLQCLHAAYRHWLSLSWALCITSFPVVRRSSVLMLQSLHAVTLVLRLEAHCLVWQIYLEAGQGCVQASHLLMT